MTKPKTDLHVTRRLRAAAERVGRYEDYVTILLPEIDEEAGLIKLRAVSKDGRVRRLLVSISEVEYCYVDPLLEKHRQMLVELGCRTTHF